MRGSTRSTFSVGGMDMRKLHARKRR
ncbi:hypothetical protein LINPERHAP2_LOCUS809 [Linum perenne]